MNRRLLVLAWLGVGCATMPPVPPAPSAPPAAAVASAAAPPGDRPCKTPAPEGGVVGGVVGGGSVFGRTGGENPAPSATEAAARFAGTVLQEVRLAHTALGQGARSDGTARYTAPAGLHDLVLEARSPLQGYGFKIRIGPLRSGTASFWVRCKPDRPRHTVAWTFTLVDGAGNRSNAIDVPVECSGQPIPGAAPRIEGLELDATDLPLAGQTGARIRIAGTHPPFQVRAAVKARGNGWTATYEFDRGTATAFRVACDKHSPHLKELRFRVIDTFGRESNVVEKQLNCGGCR